MNKPQIRFKGFDEEWIITPVYKDLTLRRGLTYSPSNISKKNEGVLVLRSSNIYNDTYVNNEDDVYVKEEAINIPYIASGDIIFTAANGSTRLVGKHCIVGKLTNKTVHGGFMLAGKSDNTYFTHYWLSAPWYLRSLSSFISGGNGALGNLKANDLLNHAEPYPENKIEREQIGNYFKRIDEMITEVEREISRLEKMKQASLQKMFPRPGETTPEIRFAGFNVPWSIKTLGEIGNTFNGLSGKTKDDFGHGQARFITYMNVFSNPISKIDMVDAVEIDNAQNSVQFGDILFTTSSETPEEVGMSSVWEHDMPNVYLNSFCFGFRPHELLNLNYMAYFLRSPYFRTNMVVLAQGISRFNISKLKAMELPILLPNKKEQQAIGEYFRSLDSLLSAKRQKLAKLRNIKQACLDKMFVNASDI